LRSKISSPLQRHWTTREHINASKTRCDFQGKWRFADAMEASAKMTEKGANQGTMLVEMNDGRL
jgi:hypothetical protein